MKELNIVPECYVDTKIAEILGQASRRYNHQHGRGGVSNKLKIDLKNEIALGIVDEDRHKPPAKYFLGFKTIREENNLILKHHRERKHYLILICPEIEKWLLCNAERVGVNPEDYRLPKDLIGLTSITKIKKIHENIEFYQFIKRLLRLNAPGIETLKTWISLFKDNQLDTLKED